MFLKWAPVAVRRAEVAGLHVHLSKRRGNEKEKAGARQSRAQAPHLLATTPQLQVLDENCARDNPSLRFTPACRPHTFSSRGLASVLWSRSFATHFMGSQYCTRGSKSPAVTRSAGYRCLTTFSMGE